MTRRAALAASLIVLAILVGGRWVIGRQPAPTSVARQVTATSTPTTSESPSSSPIPATESPLPKQPSESSSPPPGSKVPTKKGPKIKGTLGPYGTERMTGTKHVALTFDDGPHPVWTPKILDMLHEQKVKAMFCLVGTEARKYPELVQRIVREGHTLCNHTWHHELDLGTKSEAVIRANLEGTNKAIRRAVPGAEIRYFRHPGGKWTPAAVKVATSMRMVSLDWDVDPQDWAKPGAAAISRRVLANARAGSVILMHDGGGDRSGTLGACPKIISTMKRKFGVVLLQ